MLDPNMMLEATRLTRAGRLTEATALLQRMFRGEPARDKSFGGAGNLALAGRTTPIIDAESETAAPPNRFGGLRALLDRVRGRAGLPAASVSTPDIVPADGKFIEGTYSNAAGIRTYKLYIPSRYQGQALPLVVMLHGCTQSPDDFAAGTRMNLIAEEQNCFVVYPAQPSDANPAKCWNWFRPTDQRRDQGEPSLIAGITRQVMRDYLVDPQRVYVAGLSAGAAAAAIMGATYPDLYAAIGVHSGLACGAANDLPSALVAMRQGDMRRGDLRPGDLRPGDLRPGDLRPGDLRRGDLRPGDLRPGDLRQGDLADALKSGDSSPVLKNGQAVPTIVFHGDSDTTVHPRNGDHVIARSIRTANSRKTVHRGKVPGGHAYTRTIHSDPSGRAIFEQWEIHGAAHAWSGGSPAGSFTDPKGPDATREMLRFFLEHRVHAAADAAIK